MIVVTVLRFDGPEQFIFEEDEYSAVQDLIAELESDEEVFEFEVEYEQVEEED